MKQRQHCSILLGLALTLLALAAATPLHHDSMPHRPIDAKAGSVPRDVCILGGGAAGMSAAVFLKDRGYSVVVMDTAPRVGGQCDTLPIQAPGPGLPNWIDIGVQILANTAAANADLLGPWAVDTVAMVRRFAGPDSVVPLDFSADSLPRYGMAVDAGISFGRLNTSVTQEFYDALNCFNAILDKYPWIDTATIPDVVPPELLVPFSQFIATNNLSALVQPLFLPQLFAGGLGDFDRLTTLYAVLNLSPTTQSLFTGPGRAFSVVGGCQRVYDGMVAYLGADQVITNARLAVAARPPNGQNPNQPVFLNGFGTRSGSPSTAPQLFQYTCGKLVVAYAPTGVAVAPLIPDARERALFSAVETRYYFTGTLNVAGPVANDGSFEILNLGLVPPGTPPLPGLTQITRGLPYGPAQLKASSNTPIALAQMRSRLQGQLARVPQSLLTSATLDYLELHVFQPYFTATSLATSAPYGQLRQLQGWRSTYWIGSLRNFAATHTLWSASKVFVDTYFPSRVGSRQ